MSAPDWLVARPIAHRGLHDAERGVAENSGAAALAAISRNFAIECDIQISADGEAIVFHDFTLDRLTGARGRVDARTAHDLTRTPLSIGGEAPLALAAFLDLVGGRAPVVCEIKSRFDGDLRLARRAAQIVARAPGPVALESFDPSLIAVLRRETASLGIEHVPLGIVAMAEFADAEADIDVETRRSLAAMLHWEQTRPTFVSFRVDDLPHAAAHFARTSFGVPVLAWTVRTAEQTARARRFADQIVFEGESSVPREAP